MDDARVESAHGIVGCIEILATTGLVAQTPEDNAGEIAVAEHHARGAVHILRGPGILVGDAAVLSLLFPVEVALKVGLVHTVETEVVEHGVHLGLTGIVAGAHGVHIGLLHQLDVLKHSGHVNCAAVYGVGILGVSALEEDSLAVDIYLAVLDFNLAEAHLRAERHLFLLAVLLDDLEGVEVGRLGAPELEVLEVVEGEGQSLARFVGREGEGLVLCGDFLTCGREQAQEDVLLAAQGCAVVEGEGHP